MKILILYARNFKLIIYRRLQGICSIVEHALTVLSLLALIEIHTFKHIQKSKFTVLHKEQYHTK